MVLHPSASVKLVVVAAHDLAGAVVGSCMDSVAEGPVRTGVALLDDVHCLSLATPPDGEVLQNDLGP